MHTGLLDVFHNPPDVQASTVIQCIDVDFDCIFEEAVDQEWCHRSDDGLVCNSEEIIANGGGVVDDFHPATPKDIGGSNEYGIPDFLGDVHRRFDICCGSIAGSNEFVLVKNLGESTAFFRTVNRVG